jgi:type V secretory pathway adhesin AidA
MSIEAMKQALGALEDAANILTSPMFGDAAAALRTAIEQAEKQEPSYYGLTNDHLWMSVSKEQYDKLKPAFRMACYTTRPAAQREWVGLTDEAKAVINAARAAMDESTEAYDSEGSIKIASQLAASLSLCLDEYDRAIEAAHGIK